MPRPSPYTAEQIAEICSLYQAGVSSTKIVQLVGGNTNTLLRTIRRNGVCVRTASEARLGKPNPRKSRLSLDDAAFDEITEHSAYWTGFLMADGCIYAPDRRQPIICLGTAKQDRDHIEAFRSFLGSGHKITVANRKRKDANRQEFYSIAIPSARLADSLARFGVVPGKTFTAKVSVLENNRHFWRGVVDGDGCLHWNVTRGYRQPLLSVAGSKSLIEQFTAYVQKITPTCGTHPRQHRSIWYHVSIGTHAAQTIGHLYKDCAIALPRKKALASELSEWKRCIKDWSWLDADKLLNLVADHGDWRTVAEHLGISRSTLKGIRHRLIGLKYP